MLFSGFRVNAADLRSITVIDASGTINETISAEDGNIYMPENYTDGNKYVVGYSLSANDNTIVYSAGEFVHFESDTTLYIVWADGYTAEFYIDNKLIYTSYANHGYWLFEPDETTMAPYMYNNGQKFYCWTEDPSTKEYVASPYDRNMKLYAVYQDYYHITYLEQDDTEICQTDTYSADDWNMSYSNVIGNKVFSYWSENKDGSPFEGPAYDGLVLYAVYVDGLQVTYKQPDDTVIETNYIASSDAWNKYYDGTWNGEQFSFWSSTVDGDPFAGEATDGLVLYAVYGAGIPVYYSDPNRGINEVAYVKNNEWNKDFSWLHDNPNGTFLFWSSDFGEPEYVSEFNGTVTENMTLYAIFEKTYTIHYYIDGELVHTRTDATKDDFDWTGYENKPGYKLSAWRKDGMWNVPFDGNAYETEFSLYAEYQKECTVNYYVDGQLYTTRTGVTNDNYKIDAPQKNYKFSHWALHEGDFNYNISLIEDVTILYAVYNTDDGSNIIYLDTMGGDPLSKDTIVVPADGYVDYYEFNQIVPTREGYTFAGWSSKIDVLDSNYLLQISGEGRVFRLYAFWIPAGKVVYQLDSSVSTDDVSVEVVGGWEHELGDVATIKVTVINPQKYIRAVSVLGAEGAYWNFESEDKINISFELSPDTEGIYNIRPDVFDGYLNITFQNEQFDPTETVVVKTDRFGKIDYHDVPEFEKQGFFINKWSNYDWIVNKEDWQTVTFHWDETIYPIWEVAGVDVEVFTTLLEPVKDDRKYDVWENSGITVTGSGNYKSGDMVTITLTSDNLYNYFVEFEIRDENNQYIESFATLYEDEVKKVDSITQQFKALPYEKMNVAIRVTHKLSVLATTKITSLEMIKQMKHGYQFAEDVDRYYELGEEVVLKYETPEGYGVCPTCPFYEAYGGGHAYMYANGDPWRMVDGKIVYDDSIVKVDGNTVSFIAGFGHLAPFPNIVFVGYGTAEEERYSDLVTVSEGNDPGLVFVNSSEEPLEYDISFNNGMGEDPHTHSVPVRAIPMLAVLLDTKITVDDNPGEGIGPAIILVTKGIIGDTKKTEERIEVDNLSTIHVSVDAGEYINYTVLDTVGNILSEYFYEATEKGSTEASEGYVSDRDTAKHLFATSNVPITSVELDKTTAEVEEGCTVQLTATINPDNTTEDKTLTWKSSDEKVATVDKDGKVTAVKAGTATITVTASNGKTAECKITVTAMEEEQKDDSTPVEPETKQYRIIKGDGSKWTLGSKEDLEIVSDAAFDVYDHVMIEIDKEKVHLEDTDYTVETGSTVVTLKSDFLNKLAEGIYTIHIVSEDGEAVGTFSVLKATTPDKPKSPDTGDNSHIELYLMTLGLSIAGAWYVGKKKKD